MHVANMFFFKIFEWEWVGDVGGEVTWWREQHERTNMREQQRGKRRSTGARQSDTSIGD